jgi:hypothetical protein
MKLWRQLILCLLLSTGIACHGSHQYYYYLNHLPQMVAMYQQCQSASLLRQGNALEDCAVVLRVYNDLQMFKNILLRNPAEFANALMDLQSESVSDQVTLRSQHQVLHQAQQISDPVKKDSQVTNSLVTRETVQGYVERAQEQIQAMYLLLRLQRQEA